MYFVNYHLCSKKVNTVVWKLLITVTGPHNGNAWGFYREDEYPNISR